MKTLTKIKTTFLVCLVYKGKIGDVSEARMISFRMNYLSFKLAILYSVTFITTMIAYIIIISDDTYIALIASTDILINTICLLFSFKFMDKHYRKLSSLCGCMFIGRQVFGREFSQILKLVDANNDLRLHPMDDHLGRNDQLMGKIAVPDGEDDDHNQDVELSQPDQDTVR
ncbi:hypothetical protein RFI_00967 [Reticulomyxa filosa]|uniref:Uncharacterized protein n=1 Tax=Reticulomyxa filosa TaxID=46433 RepID=X6PEH4_RETFI|nr:hypothetical protein RFI_00967 [Reticulomyxa filosa]|eukprot:ETO36097.1 hypothetical protein RFI_00967 [Reticulomyxa filosa]